jgi:putative membrane protein
MKSIFKKPLFVFAAVLVWLAILSIVLAGFVSCNSSKDESKAQAEDANEQKFDKAAEKDAQFVVDQVAGNYAEVKLAQLAQQKSTNTEIKSIAAMLESDHTAVLNDLKSFATKKNISVPAEESQDAKDKIQKLNEEQPAAFDKTWCDELIAKHEKGIKTYEDASTNLEDPELKSWAANLVPKLKMHHEKLEACQKKL